MPERKEWLIGGGRRVDATGMNSARNDSQSRHVENKKMSRRKPATLPLETHRERDTPVMKAQSFWVAMYWSKLPSDNGIHLY